MRRYALCSPLFSEHPVCRFFLIMAAYTERMSYMRKTDGNKSSPQGNQRRSTGRAAEEEIAFTDYHHCVGDCAGWRRCRCMVFPRSEGRKAGPGCEASGRSQGADLFANGFVHGESA